MMQFSRNNTDGPPFSFKAARGTVLRSIFALLVVVVAGALLGAIRYSPIALLSDSDARYVILNLRLPRSLMCVLIGGTLSVLGATYQALFRNPLASPFSLGVSSGAALGAALAMIAPRLPWLAGGDVTVAAIVGAACTIILVLVVARRSLGTQGASILLVGVVFSFFCSSVLTLVQYVSDYSQLFRVTRWMMGGVTVASWLEICVTALLLLPISFWLWTCSRELDLMMFGDEMAAIKGVEVRPFYRRVFIVTSVAIGWIVAQCGVIGFLGIVVPQGVRLVVGPSHARLLPHAFTSGAVLLVLCDLLGRIVIPPYEIPVGVFTSVLGGPIFVVILLRGRFGAIWGR